MNKKQKIAFIICCVTSLANAQDLANQYLLKQQQESAQRDREAAERSKRNASADAIKQEAYTISCSPNGNWGFYKGKVYKGFMREPVDFSAPVYSYTRKGDFIIFRDERRHYEINYRTNTMYWKIILTGEIKDPYQCAIVNGNISQL